MKAFNLHDLKEHIEFLYEHGSNGDEPVLITLSEPSIGGRAASAVTGICEGIDWEHGQIRIASEKPLISKEKDRDVPRPVKVRKYDLGNGKIKKIRACPVCENHCKKDDRYCSRCWQRVEVV